MDNQTDISVNESKPKSHGCLIACLITFAALILHIAAIPFLIEIVDHIPRTKDTQTNGQYVVELQATSSPDWPFGSQDGRIVLRITIIKRYAVLIFHCLMMENPCVNPIGKLIGTKKALSLP